MSGCLHSFAHEVYLISTKLYILSVVSGLRWAESIFCCFSRDNFMPTCTSFSLSGISGRCSSFLSLDRAGQFCAILPCFSGESEQSVSRWSFPLCLILLIFKKIWLRFLFAIFSLCLKKQTEVSWNGSKDALWCWMMRFAKNVKCQVFFII